MIGPNPAGWILRRSPRRARNHGGERRAVAGAVLVCTLASSIALSAQPVPESHRWARADIGPVRLHSRARPAQNADLGRALGALVAAIEALLPGSSAEALQGTAIVAFGNQADLAGYLRDIQAGTPLATVADLEGRLLALAAGDSEARAQALRLLATDWVDALFCDAPSWLRQGLQEMLAPDASAAAAPTPAERARVALVGRLWEPANPRRSQLQRYLQLLRAGAPHEFAFEEAFGADLQHLLREVEAMEEEPPPVPQPAPAPIWEPAEPVELLIALAEMIRRLDPGNTPGAELLLTESTALAPSSPAVGRNVGRLRELDGRSEDAIGIYRDALAPDVGEPLTRLFLGTLLLERFRRQTAARKAWEPAESLPAELLEARRQLRPLGIDARLSRSGRASKLRGYAATFLYQRQADEGAVAALADAAELRPCDDTITAETALLLAHQGRWDEAWDLYQTHPRLAEGALLRKDMVEEALLQATNLAGSGQSEAALELLRSARNVLERAGEEIPELGAAEERLQRLDGAREHDRIVAMINATDSLLRRAVRAANEHDDAQLRALLTRAESSIATLRRTDVPDDLEPHLANLEEAYATLDTLSSPP